jgi:transposase
MQPVFKDYLQHQGVLFPQQLDDFIPQYHVVRLLSQVVDNLDITSIIKTYKGGGTSSYHPRMLLKVLFYAYLNNIFSTRKIEKVLHENIHFMWLPGKQLPDFRTIKTGL